MVGRMTDRDTEQYNADADKLEAHLSAMGSDFAWSVWHYGQDWEMAHDVWDMEPGLADLTLLVVKATTKERYENRRIFVWTYISREMVADDCIEGVGKWLMRMATSAVEEKLQEASL